MNGPCFSGYDIGSPYSSMARFSSQDSILLGLGLARYFALILSFVSQENLVTFALTQSPAEPSFLMGRGIPWL